MTAWWLRSHTDCEAQSRQHGDSGPEAKGLVSMKVQSCFSEDSGHLGLTAASCPKPKRPVQGAPHSTSVHTDTAGAMGSAGSHSLDLPQSRLLFWPQ